MRRAGIVVTCALMLAAGVSVVGAVANPTPASASPISVSYGKGAIRRYINKNFGVALGPYFGACQKLASNTVRCEVQFKAGLYWRCGRVSVRNSGRYDYFTARLPIGC